MGRLPIKCTLPCLESTVPMSVGGVSKEAQVKASCHQRNDPHGRKKISRTRKSRLTQGGRSSGQVPRGQVEEGNLLGGGGAVRQDWGGEEGRTGGPTHLDKDMKTDL